MDVPAFPPFFPPSLRLKEPSCRVWVSTLWRSWSSLPPGSCTLAALPSIRSLRCATCRFASTSTCCQTPTIPTPSTPQRSLLFTSFSLLILHVKYCVCKFSQVTFLGGALSLQGIGEPVLFLGSSVFFAIKDAVAAARSESGLTGPFPLDSPATAERACLACASPFTQKVVIVKYSCYHSGQWHVLWHPHTLNMKV